MKISIIGVFIMLIFSSCWRSGYKIDIDDTKDLKQIISETERLIKKIEVLSTCDDKFVQFGLRDDAISLSYSTLNYDPNDSIREGRVNPNLQEMVDTCKTLPGLTANEWTLLKKDLYKLQNYGITGSKTAFCGSIKINGDEICNCKTFDFWFFYYLYIYPKGGNYRDIGYLAVIPDSIVNTPCFEGYFKVMDKKDGLYLIKRKI